jgi:hypothetical protein
LVGDRTDLSFAGHRSTRKSSGSSTLGLCQTNPKMDEQIRCHKKVRLAASKYGQRWVVLRRCIPCSQKSSYCGWKRWRGSRR